MLLVFVKFSVGVIYEDECIIFVLVFGIDYVFVDLYIVWDVVVSYVFDDWNV